MALRKLPIGIQDFVSLRKEGYLYVDKTEFVYRLATEGKAYFLSRPRRFGKSLLLSTLGAYFEGRRELFGGLAIERLETEWKQYPVLRLDLNAKEYGQGREYLIIHLDKRLDETAERYGIALSDGLPEERFRELIRKLHQTTGERAVVLIDEYDKPLLETLGKPEIHQACKDVLKAFFGVLKSADEHLKFALLTGVTKFNQVSVFSDLNQLKDLTLHPDYATVCGITEEELTANFGPEFETLAKAQNLTVPETRAKAKYWYNGYRFHHFANGVYNPFSMLNLFSTRSFDAFWFATGTPTFLVELLKKSDYDLRELDGVEMQAEEFANYRAEADKPLPVIYQSGYLTIKSYDPESRLYTLSFPNAEVRYGFLHFLLPDYTFNKETYSGVHIAKFSKEVREGKPEDFLERLKAFFASIPYDLNDQTERHYHVVFYLVFALLGQFVRSEVKSARGRTDAVVSCRDFVYVFEFKLNGTAEDAIAQIEDKGYLLPWAADGRKVFKIGVEFDKEKRNLGRWIIG